ncbi:NACHT, LRR and PYD domains-containing protein 1 homolog isoform X2 [Enoplosus armatus]|uniref:NACHT, LRR and PYD domains-containing protein 1 homolog isoform X2 n=1 Tax=Enoplosus armatus TaxID=215367 RepID=UPI003993CFAD
MLLHRTDKVKIVDLMVQTCGQRSVEVTREVFMDMKRTDLVQRLSKPSSGLKEKHSVDEHRPTLSEKAAAMAAVKQILLETLKDLSLNELKKFKWLLPFTYFQKSLPQISWSKLDWVDSVDLLVDMMVKNQQSVEVTKEVLMDMNRTDLVKRLSETSSGLKGPSRSLELGGCGSIMDSSNWTKLEPEVDITDAAAPTYSLQSEAGNFECSVSGLRWVCKEQVSFKFQFCSWGNHMERMESIRYMPAGPLMDISVIAEKFDEVYLPHWICIDDNPKILDKFAVLHIDDCGDVVEKVAEVTPSHVKLSEPAFSLKGVLMKVGFPVKISCNMLIYYKPNTPFLKLHVYLIPHDPGLQQTVDKKEFSEGYKIIQKPRPDRYLKMQDGFILTADIDTAKVLPEKITLRHDSQDPNFYEVFIKNPDRDFPLTLLHTNKNKGKQYEEVWTCEIRKDDHHNSAHSEAAESLGPCYGATASEKQCVDEHLPALMQKVSNVTSV